MLRYVRPTRPGPLHHRPSLGTRKHWRPISQVKNGPKNLSRSSGRGPPKRAIQLHDQAKDSGGNTPPRSAIVIGRKAKGSPRYDAGSLSTDGSASVSEGLPTARTMLMAEDVRLLVCGEGHAIIRRLRTCRHSWTPAGATCR